jgi:preprotein translocase subunit Sec61beta
MADDKISMPAGFGGLIRFSEEYESKINLKPAHIIFFVILVIIFRIFLEFWFG